MKQRRTIRRSVISVLFLAAAVQEAPVGLVGFTWATALAETEEERVARALQATLEKHGGDVNRCFEKALADSLDVSGKVELAVDVGEAGKVTRAVPVEHTAESQILLACLQESATSWTIAGVGAGSTVIVPLSFEGQMAQFSVKAADAPERGPGASKGKAKAAKGGAAFTVKVLVDEATMRARQASLSLVTIAPASRIAMHKHPGAEILYVKKGRARVLGPSGTGPEVLAEGNAVFIPPGFPHVLENMVRTAPVELIQIFAPLGPERVYRDATDAAGRAAFEVIRDMRKASAPAGAKLVVGDPDKVTAYGSQGGKVKTRILFDGESTGVESASFAIAEFEPGVEIPRHSHDGSAEILYFLAGRGELHVGSEKIPIGPEQAVHLPEGQPHSARFTGSEKGVAIQVYAPAGPEQRFKASDRKDEGTKTGGAKRK